jgi:hypothetical protein
MDRNKNTDIRMSRKIIAGEHMVAAFTLSSIAEALTA